MQIDATIENLRYIPTLCTPLPVFDKSDFLSGEAFKSAAFLLKDTNQEIAISHWVSPKRTRSYPYARVYDTMNYQRRVTAIPFMKDEGRGGDRDFLQWDSVSLMSLLGVYVILAAYRSAVPSRRYTNKITNQEFDYPYLKSRLDELSTYRLDALHWNLNELKSHLLPVAELSLHNYRSISADTGIPMHGESTVLARIQVIQSSIDAFQGRSRALAAAAQNREFRTRQPKEKTIAKKATITIKNYLGGYYFFTVDEAVVFGSDIFLIEKKHSSRGLVPSGADIKDGFVKMMLYTNLSKVSVEQRQLQKHAALGLTSEVLSGYCHNYSTPQEQANFFAANGFSIQAVNEIEKIFHEANINNTLVYFMNSEQIQDQDRIFRQYLDRHDKNGRTEIPNA